MERGGPVSSDRRARGIVPRNADFEALFAMTATPTLEVTADGTVAAANRAVARLTHVDTTRLVGRPLGELFGETATEVLGADAPVDVVADLPEGPTALRLVARSRELWDGGGPNRVVQVVRREGRAAQDADRRAQSGRMTLIDDISHNLGTPLAIVAGYAETLADRWDQLGPTEVARATEAIRKHAQRAVDELRDVQARVRAVDGGTGTVPTNMLAAWLRRMLASPLAAAGSALVEGAMPTHVTVDAAVARQGLLNICQAMLGADVPAHRIHLSASTSAEGTLFTVEGEGASGLHEDHRAILDVTGSVVRDAGGTYSSDADTRVHRLRLPSYAVSARTPTRIPVAVVEDDPDAAALIRASLRSLAGVFEIVVDERTLRRGLEAVAETQPRLLVLDNNLPDGQGAESIERILGVSPRTTIVMLSARSAVSGIEDLDNVRWLEKGRAMADLGTELLGVLATS